MRRKTIKPGQLQLGGILAAAVLASAGAAHGAITASSDPALYWNQVLASGLTGTPMLTSRNSAMVSGAIHDAINATTGRPDYAFVPGVAATGGDTRAATAVAARNLLVTLNPAKTAQYDAALAASLDLVPDGAAKTQGMATGAAIASATLASRAADGSTAVVSYTPSGLPGQWAPTPPGFGPAVAPQWGDVTPFVLASGDQFRPGPPPNIGSAAYATAYNEVMAIGSATSATRTADQSDAALFWASAAGAAPWLQAGLGVAEGSGLSSIENARLFALLSVSVADAAIAVFDAKYEYDYWRPVTGIRGGDLDGNDATVADLAWTPFITTPGFPSYLSGHSGLAGAASTILGSLLGDAHQFCLTFASTRCFDSYSAAAQEAANSRLWGGIHWSFDNTDGLILGQQVAGYALASRAFDAAPEPSAWALMIAGFGLAGATLRRRRRATA